MGAILAGHFNTRMREADKRIMVLGTKITIIADRPIRDPQAGDGVDAGFDAGQLAERGEHPPQLFVDAQVWKSVQQMEEGIEANAASSKESRELAEHANAMDGIARELRQVVAG